MKKLKKIPSFKTPGAEEKFWAGHDSADYIDYAQARPALFPNLKPSSRTISIRLPESLLEALKQLANKQDVPYQSMIKILLADKVGEKMQLRSRYSFAPPAKSSWRRKVNSARSAGRNWGRNQTI